MILFQIPVNAQGLSAAESAQAADTQAVTSLGLPIADIPEQISVDQTVSANHVARLRDEEMEENIVIFRNADGTNTLYFFSEDVWYTDANGVRHDYTTALSAASDTEKDSGVAYKTINIDGDLTLPKSVSEETPISYTDDTFSITMAPTADMIAQEFRASSARTGDASELSESAVSESSSGASESSESASETSAAESSSSAVSESSSSASESSASASESSIAESGMEESKAAESSVAESTAAVVSSEESKTASESSAAESTSVESSASASEASSEQSSAAAEVSESAVSEASSEQSSVLQASSAASIPGESAIIKGDSKSFFEKAGDFVTGLFEGKSVNSAELVSEEMDTVRQSQSVEYFKASGDASLTTAALLHGFKNELVLDSYNGNNTYSYLVDLKGLTPIQSTGDSIPLVDETGEVKAFINVEDVTDAAGNVSLDNTISIAQYDDGRYLVTLAIDQNFLTSANTVYPVMLTDTTQITLTAEYINDTDVNSGSPNSTDASSSTLWVGKMSTTYRSYMQFIFPQTMKDDISPSSVSSAYLNLYEVSGNTSTFYMASSIPSDIWTYTSLTWNNQPSTGYNPYNGVGAPSLKTLTTTNTLYNIECTSFVQGSLLNYINSSVYGTVHELRGLRFLQNGEPGSQMRWFRSTNASANKPVLVINYTSTYYGDAGMYRQQDSPYINCWGYALKLPNSVTNIGIDYKFQFESATTINNAQAASLIMQYMYGLSYVTDVRSLNSSSSAVTSSEYRIAAKMFLRTYDNTEGIQFPDWPHKHIIFSYHFLVETNNSGWAQKNSETPSVSMGYIDPGNASNWGGYGTSDYTSTLYFAVDLA